MPHNFSFVDTVRRGGSLMLRVPPIRNMLFTPDDTNPEWRDYAHIGQQVLELMEAGYLLLAFDPMRSPTDQGSQASKILKAAHKKYKDNNPDDVIERKRTPKNAIKLLRVLDAHNAGVSNQNIGHDIYGVPQTSEKYKIAISTGAQHLARAQLYWRVL